MTIKQGYDPESMQVPLTVGDFLDRAAFVHPERLALVDEPEVAGITRPDHLRGARSSSTRHGDLPGRHGHRTR